jgi:8-hydroxy-5-deazaflavin:NADPH oxidoreductase
VYWPGHRRFRPYLSFMATIGLIGAGHIGSQLARLAVANGYDVVLSNSRGPETLAALVKELGPKACAGTVQEAAQAGEIVVVTIPLNAYRTVPAPPLAGKIVIDTNNYYPQRDGHIRALDTESTTTSELLQAHLPKSKVVKAFNHIYAAELTTHGQPAGTKNRRALVIAGNDLADERLHRHRAVGFVRDRDHDDLARFGRLLHRACARLRPELLDEVSERLWAPRIADHDVVAALHGETSDLTADVTCPNQSDGSHERLRKA